MFKTLCRASSRQQSSLKTHYMKIKFDVGKNRQNKIFCVEKKVFFGESNLRSEENGLIVGLFSNEKKGQKGIWGNI